MHITTLISALITLLGAVVVAIWMPGRPAREETVAEAAPAPAQADGAVAGPVSVEG
jgi:hypothetical protein